MAHTLVQQDLAIKLNPGKQELFCSLPDSIFEAFYGGAAGGGKSYALLVLPLLREFYKIPTFHGIILRRTFPELYKSQIEKAHEIYPYFGATWNDQKKRYTFPCGAKIDFAHAEQEADVRKYDSAEFPYIAFDELTSFTEFQYRFLLSRCRTSDKRLPTIVRSASNPGNIGHSWVRERFIKPCRDGGSIIIDKATGLTRIYIHAKASDNPVLLEATPLYLKQLEMLPEAEKRAKLYGDWWTFAGQVFSEFRAEHFPDEPDNAIHIIDPLTPPHYLPKILAIDWGYNPGRTIAGVYCVYPNGRAIKYKEYCGIKQKISEWGPKVAMLCSNENIVSFKLDPSAWGHRGDEKTVQEQIDDILYPVIQRHPDKADNDRIGGKNLIHEYLRWAPRDERFIVDKSKFDPDYAESLYRMQGPKVYQTYLDTFKDDKEDVSLLPKLLITRNCEETIKTLPLCVHNETKGNPEDVAEFTGDDSYDETRYAIKAIHELIHGAKGAESVEVKKAKILEALEQDKDYSRVHMRMLKLDKKISFGVKRKVNR